VAGMGCFGGEGLCGGYLRLDEFSVFMFLFGEFGVDVFDDTFERGEFHHGVRNLSTPKRLKTLIQTTPHKYLNAKTQMNTKGGEVITLPCLQC
jgi:hypothetical protein